jgi:hypothetical protein
LRQKGIQEFNELSDPRRAVVPDILNEVHDHRAAQDRDADKYYGQPDHQPVLPAGCFHASFKLSLQLDHDLMRGWFMMSFPFNLMFSMEYPGDQRNDDQENDKEAEDQANEPKRDPFENFKFQDRNSINSYNFVH